MHGQVDTELRGIPLPRPFSASPPTHQLPRARQCRAWGWGGNAICGSNIHQVGGSSGSRSLEGIWGPRHWFLREKEPKKASEAKGLEPPSPSPALLKPLVFSAIIALYSPLAILAVSGTRRGQTAPNISSLLCFCRQSRSRVSRDIGST